MIIIALSTSWSSIGSVKNVARPFILQRKSLSLMQQGKLQMQRVACLLLRNRRQTSRRGCLVPFKI